MSLDDASDALLVQQLCDGDVEALGALFNRHYALIYRTAAVITHDDQAAEDIAQDCFLRLFHHAKSINTTLPLIPWLYRVTVNLSYTWISRSQKRRVSIDSFIDSLMSPAWLAPDQIAESNEMQAGVREAIASLPRAHQLVVIMHYLTGLSLEEIAASVGCPVGTVKSRLHYARETLRHRLSGYELGRALEAF